MKSYPSQIPIFPLSGVIYLPKTNLPLNIFEKRYLDLVNDSIKKDKLMGMIQSKKKGEDLYRVGCLGKISEFKRSEDGSKCITLYEDVKFIEQYIPNPPQLVSTAVIATVAASTPLLLNIVKPLVKNLLKKLTKKKDKVE